MGGIKIVKQKSISTKEDTDKQRQKPIKDKRGKLMTENTKIIVKFKNVGIEAKEELMSSLGAETVYVYGSINALAIRIARDKVKILRADPDIDWIEETTAEDVTILGFKSDEILQTSEVLQTVPWGIEKIRATDVHLKGNKGSGINICILDTGIDYNHEDLVSQMKVGKNFVSGGNDPFDNHGHGTHVAGTIAGGIAGVYYNTFPKEWVDTLLAKDKIDSITNKFIGVIYGKKAN